MKKFTILHTIETGGPGGAENVLLNLATGIDGRQFRSLALLPYEGWLQNKLQENGIPTFIAKSRSWHDPTLLKTMVRLTWREKIDLIHSHLGDQNFYSCLAGRLTGSKVVVTYHGSPHSSATTSFREAAKLWVVRHSADTIVVVSDYLKRLMSGLRFPSDRIVRIHNGVDMNRFGAVPSGRLRAELNYHNGTKLVGMVANLRESKGYEYFIQAARKVCDCVPHARFVAIGEFDKEIERPLRNIVEQLSLQDRFFFLGFREDVPDVLRDLDVFVLSSVSEGFSIATVEAMASSRPVVVTRSGGPQEIVEDGRTGLLVPPADASSLAAAICALIENPERAAALAKSAREKVEEMFTIDKMVREYEQLYRRLLNA